MFAGGVAHSGQFLVVGKIVAVAAQMGGSIRRLLAVAFGAVAAAAAGAGNNPTALVLAASNSRLGTPFVEENLHCYNTAPAVQETRQGNTAVVADPEV